MIQNGNKYPEAFLPRIIEYYSSNKPAIALILFEKSVDSKHVFINHTESVGASNSRSLERHQ